MSLLKDIWSNVSALGNLGSGTFLELEAGNRNRDAALTGASTDLTIVQQTVSAQTQRQLIDLETVKTVLIYGFIILIIIYILYKIIS
jgi:hypothetical protein